MQATSSYNKYILYYVSGMVLFCSALLMNFMFLKNSGEFLTVPEIYAMQNENSNPILYGSGVFNSSDSLRLYTYSKKQPKIIALGSSRVLEFRQKFFLQPFYNLGTTVQNVEDAVQTVDLLLAEHTPEVILFGVDFWWFNDLNTRIAPLAQRLNHNIDPGHLLKPFVWIKDKKVSMKEYLGLQFNTGATNIGVKAKINRSGIGADGSYYKTDTVSIYDPKFNDIDFNYTKDSIRNGTNRFVYGTNASKAVIAKFVELVKNIEAKGIKVVLFFPPLPQEINVLMQDYNYAYFADLRQQFKDVGLNVHDYTAAYNHIQTNDCEFADGYHGGDVLYAKMLAHLAGQTATLQNYVNNEYLNEVGKKYSGLAMIPDPSISTEPEIDFLCKGCNKHYES